MVEVKSDKLSPDIHADMARLAAGEAPQTLEGRKAVALKRWEQLNPDRLSYHVMFADTALHDAGKKVVMDFITNAAAAVDVLSRMPADFMAEGRQDTPPQERESF